MCPRKERSKKTSCERAGTTTSLSMLPGLSAWGGLNEPVKKT